MRVVRRKGVTDRAKVDIVENPQSTSETKKIRKRRVEMGSVLLALVCLRESRQIILADLRCRRSTVVHAYEGNSQHLRASMNINKA